MNWKDLIESQKDMNKNKKFQEYLALKKAGRHCSISGTKFPSAAARCRSRIYVYDNFCHFGVCMVTKTKLLVKSKKTEMEID